MFNLTGMYIYYYKDHLVKEIKWHGNQIEMMTMETEAILIEFESLYNNGFHYIIYFMTIV